MINYERLCNEEKKAECRRHYSEEILQAMCLECQKRAKENKIDNRVYFYIEMDALLEAGCNLRDELDYNEWLSLANYRRAVRRIVRDKNGR